MNIIVFPSTMKKLKSVLQTFLDQIIKPRFRDAYTRIEDEFKSTIVINHHLDDAIRLGTPLSTSAAQQIKRYADYQMMRGEHKVAYSLYHQLVSHFPPEKSQGVIGSLISLVSSSSSEDSPSAFTDSKSQPDRQECLMSAVFGATCCDIIIGEISSETVRQLYFLRDNSTSIQHRLLHSLLAFWVLPRIGRPSPDVLVDFLDFASGAAGEIESQEAAVQTRQMAKSSSFGATPILNSIHASFSLNNIARTIYRQLSSDDFSTQTGEKVGVKLTFPMIVEPFLHEQIIQFYSMRQLPFQYFLLARRFDMIEQRENSVRCMWNSFITLMGSEGGPQYHNCELCLAFLIEKIVNVLLRQKNFTDQPNSSERWFLADYIGYLMRFDNIARLPVFASLFSMWNSRGVFYKAGFVRASVVSFEASNPSMQGPSGYRGSWRQLSTRMFGCGTRSDSLSFFVEPESGDVCDTVADGDELRVRVIVTNKVEHFSVGEVWLRVRGGGESAVCEHKKVGSAHTSDVCLSVRPSSFAQKSSVMQVEGINVVWVNNVGLYTLFRTPLSFRCVRGAPRVTAEVVCGLTESIVGECAMARVVLHVGPVPLKSLSLLVEGDNEVRCSTKPSRASNSTSFALLSPRCRSVGGQFFVGPVGANEDIEFDLACASTVCGLHTHWLFFPFRGEVGSSRYVSVRFDVNVRESPCRTAMFPAFFGLLNEQGIELSLSRVRERSFTLTVTNTAKKPARCVCVEILEKRALFKSAVSSCVPCFVSDMVSGGFASNFGCYFDSEDEPAVMDESAPPEADFTQSFERFIVSGFTKKIFESIGARKSASFSFGFESLDHETYPHLRVTVNGKSYLSDMSAILHYYDTHM